MKFTLTIETETEEELKTFTQARDWYGLAWDFAEWMREQEKYWSDSPPSISDVRGKFYEMLNERGLEL